MAPPLFRIRSLQNTLVASWRLSPNFIPIAATFLVSAVLLFTGVLYVPFGVFVFVTSGWIVSLCLHEAAHALAAWYGGDRSVLDKGYLSLNPMAYAHPEMSFIMPVLFLVLGGIGLPGGAVYIDHAALRSRHWQALVSLAGPLANLACLLALAIPFLFGLHLETGNGMFWSAVAFLAALQASAVVLNLLPIPGFDGFGILGPYLPDAIQVRLWKVAGFMGAILLLLFMFPAFNREIWGFVRTITGTLGISADYVGFGSHAFRFWR